MRLSIKPLSIAAICCLAACSSKPVNVASQFVVSKSIQGSQGGQVSVPAGDASGLGGTSINIPANALPSGSTTITISITTDSVTSSGQQSAGPVAQFGPPGTTFSVPATITLPYVLSGNSTAAELAIGGLESNGTRLTINAGTSYSVATPSTGTLSGPVSGFTDFGAIAILPGCQSDMDCPSGELCVNGICQATTMDGGPFCGTGLTQCPSGCTNVETDVANCGACGQACTSAETCKFGMCTVITTTCTSNADCPTNEECLNGQCQAITPVDGGPVCNGMVCCDGSCAAPGQACPDVCPAPDAGLTCPPNETLCCGQCLMGGGVCPEMCPAPDAGLTCPPNETLCCGQCLMGGGVCPAACPGSDAGNPMCGSDADCPPNLVCIGGVCQSNPTCPTGETLCCDGTCAATGQACPMDCPVDAGQVCPMGESQCCGICQPSGIACSALCAMDGGPICNAGMTSCNGLCTDVSSDPNNCGGCGDMCPSGDVCSSGVCVASSGMCQTNSDCPSGEACMGGVCTNVNACVMNCGVGCAAPGAVCYSDGQQYCSACVAACYGATQVKCTDGGASDAGAADGGRADGGKSDGGKTDGGRSDGGKADGGASDAGPSDAGMACGTDTDCFNVGGTCCSGSCANINTDPKNCGACGEECPAGDSCSQGVCVASSCSTDSDCPTGLSCVNGMCS